jgi:hypothetical protein
VWISASKASPRSDEALKIFFSKTFCLGRLPRCESDDGGGATPVARHEHHFPITDQNSPITDQNFPIVDQNSRIADQNFPIADENFPIADENLPISMTRLSIPITRLPDVFAIADYPFPITHCQLNEARPSGTLLTPSQPESCKPAGGSI